MKTEKSETKEILNVAETITESQIEDTSFEYQGSFGETVVSKQAEEENEKVWFVDSDLVVDTDRSGDKEDCHEAEPKMRTEEFIGQLSMLMLQNKFTHSTTLLTNEAGDVEFLNIKHQTKYVGKHNYVEVRVVMPLQMVVKLVVKIEHGYDEIPHEHTYEECLEKIKSVLQSKL